MLCLLLHVSAGFIHDNKQTNSLYLTYIGGIPANAFAYWSENLTGDVFFFMAL